MTNDEWPNGYRNSIRHSSFDICSWLYLGKCRALLDELRQHAYGNFMCADGGNVQSDWARDAVELFRRGDFLFDEIFAHDACFAATANHAEKRERKPNPFRQHQRVMLMAARDDQTERRRNRRWNLQQLMPASDAKLRGRWEKLVVRQFWPVIENGDCKIELLRQWHDSLRHMAGAGNPQFHRRGNVFGVKPVNGAWSADLLIGGLRWKL